VCVCVDDYDMLTPTRDLPPLNTAAVTAHSAHSVYVCVHACVCVCVCVRACACVCVCVDDDDMLTPTRDLLPKYSSRHGPQLGLYTILPLPILYSVWHTKGGSGGRHVLRNRRAIVLQ